jgi:hypothetical protein
MHGINGFADMLMMRKAKKREKESRREGED